MHHVSLDMRRRTVCSHLVHSGEVGMCTNINFKDVRASGVLYCSMLMLCYPSLQCTLSKTFSACIYNDGGLNKMSTVNCFTFLRSFFLSELVSKTEIAACFKCFSKAHSSVANKLKDMAGLALLP